MYLCTKLLEASQSTYKEVALHIQSRLHKAPRGFVHTYVQFNLFPIDMVGVTFKALIQVGFVHTEQASQSSCTRGVFANPIVALHMQRGHCTHIHTYTHTDIHTFCFFYTYGGVS